MGKGVKEITGRALDGELSAAKGALVVVDFYATWCGPCKHIAPFVEQLASKHPDVVFLKVCEGTDGTDEAMARRGVRAFPTFQLYISGAMVHEMKGANPQALEATVVQYKAQAKPAVAAFSGAGMSLGSSGGSSSSGRPEDVRAARLARLGAPAAAAGAGSPTNAAASTTASATGASNNSSNSSSSSSSSSAATSPTKAVSAPAPALAAVPSSRPIPAAVAASLDLTIVATLVDMGFDQATAAAAAGATKGQGIEAAVEWIESHPQAQAAAASAAASVGASGAGGSGEDDVVMVDEGGSGKVGTTTTSPSSSSSAAGADGLSDEDRAAIAAAEAELEGNVNGSAGGRQRLSPAEVQALLARRRAEKAAAEKEAERQREIKRREDGRKAIDMAEELAAIQRKREADKRKAEAEFTRKEKARLHLEILKDRADKYSDAGQPVPHDLAEQIQKAARAYQGLPEEGDHAAAPKPETAREQMEKALKAVSAFKTGDARGTAASTLRTLVRNVLEKPAEPKFRTVNLANEKIKERLVAVTGSIAFLKAAGWAKDEGGSTMTLTDAARDEGVLRTALEVLDAAAAPGGVLTQ